MTRACCPPGVLQNCCQSCVCVEIVCVYACCVSVFCFFVWCMVAPSSHNAVRQSMRQKERSRMNDASLLSTRCFTKSLCVCACVCLFFPHCVLVFCVFVCSVCLLCVVVCCAPNVAQRGAPINATKGATRMNKANRPTRCFTRLLAQSWVCEIVCVQYVVVYLCVVCFGVMLWVYATKRGASINATK